MCVLDWFTLQKVMPIFLLLDCKTVIFFLTKARSAVSVDSREREPHTPGAGRPQSHSPFSHSVQTFRSKTARTPTTNRRKKYDCFAVYLAVVFYPLCPTDSIHSVKVEFW